MFDLSVTKRLNRTALIESGRISPAAVVLSRVLGIARDDIARAERQASKDRQNGGEHWQNGRDLNNA